MDKETEKLQNEEWDFENPQVVRARGKKHGSRTVVSVSLSSDEFEILSAMAEARDLSVSKYIRQAALHSSNLELGRPTYTAYAPNMQVFYMEGAWRSETYGARESHSENQTAAD